MSFHLQNITFDKAKLNKLYKQTVQLIEKQEFEKAITLFMKILQEEPENCAVWMNLGITYFWAKNFTQATETFKLAHLCNPELIEAKFNHAAMLSAMEKFPEAMKELEAIVKIKPDFINARIELAKLYIHQGEYQKALNNFHSVLLKDFYNIKALLGAAEVYVQTNQFDKAIEYFERLLKLTPSDAYVLYKLGCLYGDQKDYDHARKLLEKTLVINPEFHESLFMLAKIDNLTEKPAEAIMKLKDLNAKHPNNFEILLEYGVALGNMNHIEEAISFFNKAAELQPDSAEVWKLLAISYNKFGNKEKATECEIKYKILLK
ncbi:MAG: tetratricopeptide repeat protein [Asgard group archaeon]|nr:tetratricopeptide repeat protein [Asgard group archaeon]